MVKEPITSSMMRPVPGASSSRVRSADDGSMRGIRRPVASALLGLTVVVASAVTPAAGGSSQPAVAASRPATSPAATIRVATGVTYTRIREAAGPWIVHVVEVDPSEAPTLDIATAGARIGRFARPSVIGSTRGALVAINGDFSVDRGRPLHPLARDGVLLTAGLQNGAHFAVSQDELARYVSNDRLAVSARNLSTELAFAVSDWNTGVPLRDGVAAFTRYGGQVERPPAEGCAVRLRPVGGLRWGTARVGVARDYRVEASRCASTPMWVQRGAVVLASTWWGTGAAELKEMDLGQTVRLTWSFGWAGVMDSVGGMPLIVDDGRNIGPRCASSFCGRNPRTALAVRADGTLLLVVVDGRKRSSVGMTLTQLGRYLVDLGAVHAINLDGGGSSSMWIRGEGVVNDPSDSTGERALTNAVLVLPGADVGEPIPAMPGASTLSSSLPALAEGGFVAGLPISDDEARAWSLASMDAGSTGGLLDAMLTGDLGPVGVLPPSLVRTARAFRAAA